MICNEHVAISVAVIIFSRLGRIAGQISGISDFSFASVKPAFVSQGLLNFSKGIENRLV